MQQRHRKLSEGNGFLKKEENQTLPLVTTVNDGEFVFNGNRHKRRCFPEQPEMIAVYKGSLFVSCVLFGIGSWLLINAVFSQMPTLVINLPEGWNLPSYFSLLVQLANVSPLAYSLLKHKRYFLSDSKLIVLLMAVGTGSMFALAFTYDKTVSIFGMEAHSVYLFALAFLMSMVGCTSSVLFIPFMSTLPEPYMVPFFIGEGISGLLPSVITLIQGVQTVSSCVNVTTDNGTSTVVEKTYNFPLFSSAVFFVIIGVIMLCSTLSFVYLSFNSFRNDSSGTIKSADINQIITYPEESTAAPSGDCKTDAGEGTPLSNNAVAAGKLMAILLAIQLVISMLGNGILPGLESYSCLPYGNEAYNLAVNVGQLICPITFYLTIFMPIRSPYLLAGFFSCCCICLGYQITTAFLSPNPPFVGTLIGVIIVIAVWVLSNASISYVKLSIATMFRRNKQKQGLFYYGVVTQIGAAIGSLLSFYLINYSHLLKASSSNSNQC